MGCAPVPLIKDLSHRNVCVIQGCPIRTTPEGLCCRKHWEMVPGIVKAQYQAIRILVIQAAKAYEEVP